MGKENIHTDSWYGKRRKKPFLDSENEKIKL
jgi:hypothetical protein